MRSRSLLAVTAALLLTLAAAGPAGSLAAAQVASCDPMQTPPSFRGEVPTAEQVLGFPLGSREVTAAESDTYVDAVDAASARVVSGTLGTTWEGRPIRYALVGSLENVTPEGLAGIQEAARALRDPATSDQQAAEVARRAPAVLWLMGNVHGGEESPTDAELRVLYELADRDDCAARQILDNALVGIIPMQNPDGREADTRQNSYGFDMNRDWFARTQRETDTKLELLRQYPGVLYVDAHEMGGNHYFFPPTADPTYHEVTAASMDWQDNLYGGALAAEFDRQHIQYFTNKVFDFFAMVYGDIVPATGFGGAGMTFEKASFDRSPSGPTSTTSPTGSRSRRPRCTSRPSCVAGTMSGQKPTDRAWTANWSPTRSTTRATPSSSRCPPSRSAITSSAPTTPPRPTRCRHWCGGCSAWTSRSTA